MCMPVNQFLGSLVQAVPTFTRQCDMFRNQGRTATVGGNGSPRQAQYILFTPLTTTTDTANNDGTGLHCQLGLVAQYNWRTTAQAVFLCVPYGSIVLMGCMGRRSRLPVPVTGRPTLYSPSPNAWSLLVMDLIPITGASTMTTPTQKPSSVSQTFAAVICILQNLNPDTYTHTSTLLAAFKAQGIKRDLRSIQRYLVALADYSLVEHDNHHPKGWKLRTNPNKYAIEAILAMGVQA
ncbi:MAG TPA: hypothetical protein PLF28_02780 [Agitococcus sp.]|nr:hypothetical protein [Agitococcus sp.]HMX99157.1 hypothetical protein [Agitococcus sp.]HNC02550.1 hypothetical protein [Agitococcus sp.]HNH45009.1 hypothetical protein [Agitococcus sp.]HNI62369.1 hypothetical protein [Agitococcus sp.]